MYIFDLLTTNYPKENIWHNPDRDKYNCNKKAIEPTTKYKGVWNNAENIISNHAHSKATYRKIFCKYRKRYSVRTKRSAPISTTPVGLLSAVVAEFTVRDSGSWVAGPLVHVKIIALEQQW